MKQLNYCLIVKFGTSIWETWLLIWDINLVVSNICKGEKLCGCNKIEDFPHQPVQNFKEDQLAWEIWILRIFMRMHHRFSNNKFQVWRRSINTCVGLIGCYLITNRMLKEGEKKHYKDILKLQKSGKKN